MYNEKIEALIKAALADGVLTEKEKQVLFKRAHEQGIDLDEFEMVLDAKLFETQEEEKKKRAKAAPESNKYADVKKCPACGTIIPPNTKVCPGCGMLFSNTQEDIKDIAKLQDNYVKISKVVPKFPYGALFLALYVLVFFLNFLPWIYSITCNLGWLGLAIPLTILTIVILFFYDTFQCDKEKKVYSVFDGQYNSMVAEHNKLLSTAKAFYSQDKSVLKRLDDIDATVQSTISKNAKTSNIYMSLSYGVLALVFILSLVFYFGPFSRTMDRHNLKRTEVKIARAINKNKLSKAEFYYTEFVDDFDYSDSTCKRGLAETIMQAYINNDNEVKAEEYFREAYNYAHHGWGSNWQPAVKQIVTYYISKDKYQSAIDIVAKCCDSKEAIEYALELCIKDYVKKDRKSDALALIKANSYLFNDAKSDSDYYKPKVVKKLTRLISE